ncbi:hypothetical protein MCUN1_003887 [Malassezia cuniculi]|uniref:Sterol regulatory element-binding protein cleavage-activating protein n=1 Tax=Malassezia cuniculi TaxID=948313 RepID=A0AAF0EXQ9_9BASI|nr:hypothetical protein MCUN1_003887 [Malassezia cuniculi]
MLRRRQRGPPAHPTCELSVWTPRGVPPRPQHTPWTVRAFRRFFRAKDSLDARFRAAFARHGRWISLHQTRTLLLCNLVIASLFYPAVVLYLLMTSGAADAIPAPVCVERHLVQGTPACVSGAHAPHSIWGAFRASLADLAGTSPSFRRADEAYPVHDLHLIWDETPSLQVVEEPDVRDDIPRVHVAQVIITADVVRAGGGPPYGVLQPHTLLAARKLQDALSRSLSTCVRDASSGECLVLSPLDYWPSTEAIVRDGHPAKSITGSPLRGIASPPVAPTANASVPRLYSTTLAGRWPYLPLFSRAEFLVLTYFLEDMDGWDAAVAQAAAGANVSMPSVAPGSTYLRFWPQSYILRPTLHFGVVAVGYLLLLVYIFRGLVQMRRLHSRFGIAFTGAAQLMLDMIMSLSLCALLGIQLNAVPWALLPFVIVVVGSESMLYMIRTITNTPLSLTVHSRIAYGLSQVAEPITLTVVSDIVIIALVCSLVRTPSVIQFCAFVMCTLVVDYFMQMTFFVTVLSIDMQRLELAEVLVQGQPTAPIESHDTPPPQPLTPPPSRPRGASSILMNGIALLWRTRSARSMSFILFMASLAACCMYYGKDFGTSRHVADPTVATGAYAHFWTSVNPGSAPLVNMITQPWTLVSFAGLGSPPEAASNVPGPWLERLFFYRRAATLLLIVIFVAFPIAASMVLLSLVLHYLRRDAERLEDTGSPDAALALVSPDKRSLVLHVTAHTTALHAAAIMSACGKDGVIVSVDTAGTVRVGKGADCTVTSLSATRQSHGLTADATRIVAVDTHAGRVALGHVSGRISVYDSDWKPLLDEAGKAAVCHVEFMGDALLTLYADGSLFSTPVALPSNNGGVTWGANESRASAHRLVRPLEGVWRHVPLDTTAASPSCARCVCASSDKNVRLYSVTDERAQMLCSVSTPTLVSCAALVAAPETHGDSFDLPDPASDAQLLLPQQGPPPRTRSPRRSTTCGTNSAGAWLVAGGDGVVHAVDTNASQIVASLVLENAGPVTRIQTVEAGALLCVLVAHTADRVSIIGMRTDGASLSLLASVENVRGAADVFPWHMDDTTYLVGVRRAEQQQSQGSVPRWEAWRMRIPHFSPSTMTPTDSTPALECAQLDLESLVREGALATHRTTQRLPPTQLPLLSSRIDRMVRADAAKPTWLVPLGSVLVTLEASFDHC